MSMKKKSTITEFAAKQQEKFFETEFEEIFARMFKPCLVTVLKAARLQPTYAEARYHDDAEEWKAAYLAVHDICHRATCRILAVVPTPCAAHGKS